MTDRNFSTRTIRASRPLLAAVLLCASLVAQAADDLPSRAATGVGQWIAAQGNAALKQIGDDLRREIDRQIKPLLPEPAAPATPVRQ